jgi:hypothetical protein
MTASLLGALVRGEECILKNKGVKVRREREISRSRIMFFWNRDTFSLQFSLKPLSLGLAIFVIQS